MLSIYSLRKDIASIEKMQAASTSGDMVGLCATDGLVGSAEWWTAIDSGRLVVITLRGILRGLWLGQGRLGPAEFTMQLDGDREYNSLCYVEPDVAKNEFVLGRDVELDYVVQTLKFPWQGRKATELCIEIRLGSSIHSNIEPIWPCE